MNERFEYCTSILKKEMENTPLEVNNNKFFPTNIYVDSEKEQIKITYSEDSPFEKGFLLNEIFKASLIDYINNLLPFIKIVEIKKGYCVVELILDFKKNSIKVIEVSSSFDYKQFLTGAEMSFDFLESSEINIGDIIFVNLTQKGSFNSSEAEVTKIVGENISFKLRVL